ncbi:MAG: hypothetical protein IKS41_01135 [Alphaproteobacteria bacterium]|nr:hypothetical protein [Alphaproteobacteria bacterium]
MKRFLCFALCLICILFGISAQAGISCAKGYINYNGACIKKLDCKNGGKQEGYSCTCPKGWTGELCQKAATCPYKDTKCSTGYHATGKTCKTGNKTVIQCAVNECKDYPHMKCPTGYTSTGTCQSGKTKRYKCDACAKGYIRYNGQCIKKLDCKNGGKQKGNSCTCPEGWTGSKCDKAASCPYKDTKCAKGYHETGKTCKTGKKTVKECKANACEGYTYTKCPTGYASTGSCQSGKTTKYKCDACAKGYIRYNGQCIKKLDCKNGGKQKGNSCTCPEGWTGKQCQTAASCSYKTTSCSSSQVETGNTCKSGNKTYIQCASSCPKGKVKQGKKCVPAPNCQNGGHANGLNCVCPDGWTGTLCEKPKTCPADYTQESCGEGYEQVGSSCKSGDKTYVACTEATCPYNTTSCTRGYEETGDTCLSGTTLYKKCREKSCAGYIMGSCPQNAEGCEICYQGEIETFTYTKCKDGWTGLTCNVPANCPYDTITCPEGYEETGETCQSGDNTYRKCKPTDCTAQGYKATCPEGYNSTQECLSGTTPYYTCTPKQVPAGYQSEPCGAGYNQVDTFLSGETTYYKCEAKQVPSGYQSASCGAGYDQVDTFLSGKTTYYKCQAKDCSAYQTGCSAGYTAEQSCLSGTTPYYTCVPKVCPDGYNTKGTSCSRGYVQAGDVCLSGEDTYVKCVPNTCPDTHNVLGSCGEGYVQVGEACYSEDRTYVACTEATCPYDTTSCTRGYEETGDTCLSGTTLYKKCREKSCAGYIMGSCPQNAEGCETCYQGEIETFTYTKCKDGWTGLTCNVPANCPFDTLTCEGGYEETGETCQSGDKTYKKCQPIDCSAQGYKTSCTEGYDAVQGCLSGTTPYYTCTPKQVPAEYQVAPCGSGYNQINTFLSGETTYYKCEAIQVPDGYQSASCGAGYDQVDTFLSGETTYYKCQETDCSAYQTACGAGYDATEACLSGTTPYYTCTEKEVPTGYGAEPCGTGYDLADTFLSGDKTYYKCVAKEVPARYQATPCGAGYDEISTFLSGTATYYECQEKDCSQYQAGCGEGYDAAQACLSGTTPYYTCTEKQVPDGYSSESCDDGYKQTGTFLSGTTTYYQCAPADVPNGYVATSCGAGYDQVDTFLSGETTYYKCQETDCSAYQTACGAGYDATEACLSGTTPYYTCTAKQVPAEYQADPCGAGYNTASTFLSGETTYYQCVAKQAPEGYQMPECAAGYDEVATFLSGDTVYHQCVAKQVPPEYNAEPCGAGYDQVGTFLSGETTYYKCQETDCSAYQTACGDGYDATEACLSGTTHYYTCTAKEVPAGYVAEPCGAGYNTTSTFLSGETTYYKCVANACDGYPYANACPTGYAPSSSCLSGDTTMYQCNTCAEGYISDGNGGCVLNVPQIGKTGETNNDTIEVENTGNDDVYGLHYDVPDKPQYHDVLTVVNARNSEAQISIENEGDGNVYGIHATGYADATNALGENAIGTINISNIGDGAVYGLYSEQKKAFNTEDNGSGSISITNEGDGNIYGIWGNDEAVNADDEGEGTIEISNTGDGNVFGVYAKADYASNSDGTGSISITNIGNGSVYGVWGKANDHPKGLIDAYNADDMGSNGTIEISNTGDGNVYGVWGNNGAANAGEDGTDGSIEISNTGSGNVYGVYANGWWALNAAGGLGNITLSNTGDGSTYGLYAKEFAHNGWDPAFASRWLTEDDGDGWLSVGHINIENNGTGTAYGAHGLEGAFNFANEKGTSSIEIANNGSGLAVGMYAPEVNNMGNIHIENYGNGTAIGLYTTQTAENTGNISIDNYKNGVAVGIMAQGEGDKTVTNAGTITIRGKQSLVEESEYLSRPQVWSNEDKFWDARETYEYFLANLVNFEQSYADIIGNSVWSEYWNSSGNWVVDAEDIIPERGIDEDQIYFEKNDHRVTIRDDEHRQNEVFWELANDLTFNSQQEGDILVRDIVDWDDVRFEDGKFAETPRLSDSVYYWTDSKGQNHATSAGEPNTSDYTYEDSEGTSHYLTIDGEGNLIIPTNLLSDSTATTNALNVLNEYNQDKENYTAALGILENDRGELEYAISDFNQSIDNLRETLNAVKEAYGRFVDNYYVAYDMAHEEWENDREGLAIGIYGDRNTHIVNTGKIVIDNSKWTFGIYTEGGDVTNRGQIIIDGDYLSKNAIVLNGGNLFQNGLIYTYSDWNNIQQKDSLIGKEGSVNNDVITLTNNIERDVYGIKGISYSVKNAFPMINGAEATGYINISNYSDGNVYGVSGDSPRNAHIDQNNTIATAHIQLDNIGNGNVYGLYSESGWAENIREDGVTTNVHSEIIINNKGNGVVCGVKGEGEGHNINIWADSMLNSDVNALINITNQGNGTVYGVYSSSRAFNIGGARVPMENSDISSIIRIHNDGDADIYGVYGHEVHNNEIFTTNPSRTGLAKVSISNTGAGNAYGLFGYNPDNMDQGNALSIVEMANIGNGLAVGMYAKREAKNSGTITIHNLGNGTAVGMLVDDNGKGSNSGTITIDREAYTDDMGTPDDTSDDVTYEATLGRGGMAIGIYGGVGSTITNTETGIINISGINKAYGIYSESGNVTNLGQIIINGNSNHANAIKLNSGKLFQDGKLIVAISSDDCDEGYALDENGNCVLKDENVYGKVSESNDSTLNVVNSKYADVYGLYGNGEVVNARDNDASISVTNTGDGNVYGVYSPDDKANNVTNDLTGTINISNAGNGNVYGVYSAESLAFNAGSGAGNIFISNVGTGDVYGVYGKEEAVNSDDFYTTGNIRISNTGSGNVYGLFSPEGWSGNAWDGTGNISLLNTGNGTTYGMYSGALAHNGWNFDFLSRWESEINAEDEDQDEGYGHISIVNNGNGNAYGMFGARGAFNHYNDEDISTIEIANIGNGLAVGMYSNEVNNLGDITIHNLGNGTAVGMMTGDFGIAENSGRITIDREAYTDNNGTPDDTSDDTTYSAASSGRGGMAFGIYGGKNSLIYNTGTIDIRDAEKAYGIYSEGGRVINEGSIIIDGDEFSANAIKLNAGQFFQNGILTATTDPNTCPVGYTRDEFGRCAYIMKNDFLNDDTLSVANTDDVNIYGLYYTVPNQQNSDSDTMVGVTNAKYSEAEISITNESEGNVYGVYASGYTDTSNSAGYPDGINDGKQRYLGVIDISNTGNGNVYGVYNAEHNAFNTESGLGRINITNAGNGDVYGIWGGNEAVNSDGDDSLANLRISNTGTGNVYGVFAQESWAGNAWNGIGNLSISNTGNGTTYGIRAGDVAHNGWDIAFASKWVPEEEITDDDYCLGVGHLKVVNNGNGNAYGVFGPEGAFNYTTDVGTSTIEIANVGSGLAVGMHSSEVNNMGDITIHNLGNGVAVGMMTGDFGIVENSGTITIDRVAYIDDNGTPDNTSDDVRYEAALTRGGTAIGIYGGAGSTITNTSTGVINISGAEKAYGIYSAGGQVVNNGQIIIDGILKGDEAITLAGGKLFQNGKLVVGSIPDNLQSRAHIVGKIGEKNNATITIENSDYVDVYGISSGVDAANASAEDDNENVAGTINITNTNNGNVYAVYSDQMEASNAEDGFGEIFVNNIGNGDVYGVYGNTEAANADEFETVGNIRISNAGSGNVYGVFAKGGWAGNAWAGAGNLSISNTGDGTTYGLYASQYAHNGWNYTFGQKWSIFDPDDIGSLGVGHIRIVNNGNGNAYGMQGVEGAFNFAHEKGASSIEIANVGSGLAVGMHSSEVNNMGDITIHNLGNGTAVGMLVNDNGVAENSGTITIDRVAYTDDNGTPDDTSDDTTYEAASEHGGRAIGIYGGKNSTITNTGIISITGADDAYGIYAEEGSTFTNSGQIIIDGDSNHANAIKLNGGKLFQNGKLIANADVEDITHPDTGSEIILKTLTEEDDGNNETIKAVVNSTSSIIGIEAQNSVSNIILDSGSMTATVDITQRGVGDVYGMRGNVSSSQDIKNVDLAGDSAMGAIKITDTSAGTGNIYGMYSNSNKQVENAHVDGENDSMAMGIIDITNTSDKDIYGILNLADNEYDDGENGTINSEGDEGTSIGYIIIDNSGNGDVYGIKAINPQFNSESTKHAESKAYINIKNSGLGSVYGMYGEEEVYNARAGHDREYGELKDYSSSTGVISIDSFDSSDVYGIKSTSETASIYNAMAWDAAMAKGTIRIHNVLDGDVYGMSGKYIQSAGTATNNGIALPKAPNAESVINIINHSLGDSYGLYSDIQDNIINHSSYTRDDGIAKSTLEMANIDNGFVVGIYSKNGTVNNSGDIKIHNLYNGTAVGIYADGTTNVTNSGTITIDRGNFTDDMGTEDTSDDVTYTSRSTTGGLAIGIYGGAGSTITNTGTISITGADDAYGIYSEGESVVNNGQIMIDGVLKNGNEAVVLNGGRLFQNGKLVAAGGASSIELGLGGSTTSVSETGTSTETPKASLNLNDFGGSVIASETSEFIVEGALSGDLTMNNSVISNGFRTVYTVPDMILAGDTSGLNLISESALFDVSLADNGHDVVMTMRGFDAATDNRSFANFLARNYALKNNEAFFNTLKEIGNMATLTDGLDKMMGKEMLSRFNFEDMTMMRELNFDMNNHLFNNKDYYFSMGGSVSSPMAFRGDNGSNSRYSLASKKKDSWSLGLGIAFTDIRSDDDHDNNSRSDTMYQMIVPVGYQANGFKFVMSPRIGYARGHYDRTGFDNKNYDGTIEKRIFGLMNEVRYPIALDSWRFEPAMEFNALGYEQKGWEDKKEFSLNIPRQRTYSIESGIGLYATHETKWGKDTQFKFTAGVAAYHEFADPYRIDVGMDGMNGRFTLRDEKRSDNRGVVRAGFEIEKKDYSVYGSFISYVDKEVRSKAKLGFKWKF